VSAREDPARDDDEIDLFHLAGVLWRGRWMIALCVTVAVAIGGYYAYRIAVPLYPAQVTVALSAQQQQVIGDIESVITGGGTDVTAINTEFEVIRSRSLVGDLVDTLGLVNDPEFNGALRPPSPRQALMNRIMGREPGPPPHEEVTRRRVIDALVGRISVSSIRQSLAFNISIQTTDPGKSTEIVNTLAELYVSDQVRQKLESTASAIEFLSRRTSELQANVEALEQQLAETTEQSNVITADLLQARNLQLSDLRERIGGLERQIAIDETMLELLRPDQDRDALLSGLAAVDDARSRAILRQFQDNGMTDEALQAQIAELNADLAQGIDRNETQLATLTASAEDLATRIRAQSGTLIDLQQLEREVQAARLLYETFLTRLQEASVQQGLETADARILSEAVPRGAASPQKSRILLLSAILGAVLGAGIVLLREWKFAGFRTSDDLRRETDKRVFGSIPMVADNNRREVLRHMRDNPSSVFGEAIRNLRTSILMASIDQEPKVILVTSAIPGEGKTTLAIALARYLSLMEGKRTLLLEADIRRKALKAYVDEEPEVSLVDLLLGKYDTSSFNLFSEELGIEVISGSESGGTNAADLFASKRFREFVEIIKTEYDYIVIDTPPVLAVPDARVLAGFADSIVFAVQWSSTTKTQVRQGLEMLDSVGATVNGLVMTQVDQRKMKTYGYGGQYGYDGYATGYYTQQ